MISHRNADVLAVVMGLIVYKYSHDLPLLCSFLIAALWSAFHIFVAMINGELDNETEGENYHEE